MEWCGGIVYAVVCTILIFSMAFTNLLKWKLWFLAEIGVHMYDLFDFAFAALL